MIPKIKQLLQKELKKKLSDEELSLVPSSYQKIGDVVVVNLKKELWKYEKVIGRILLKNIPRTRTVCRRTDFITSQFRQPNVKVIAGEKNTETIHKEHGIKYKIDVSKIMFSKGNLTERKRLVSQVKEGEIIIDMFSGIGYFSVGLGKFSKAKKIYAIEINPVAYHYLRENIKLNKVGDKVIPILGDCKKQASELGRVADRVIMGLLPTPKKYLPVAMKIIKNKGIIHYHSILGKNESYEKLLQEVKSIAKKQCFKVELLEWKEVKSYAPKVDHVVLDCKVLFFTNN